MDEVNGVAMEHLKRPYSRILVPDEETGTYTAKIAEFPGCVAQGDTPEEAYRNLEVAAESWIEELLGMGQVVPEPAADNRYGGRIALRLPKSLHRNAARLAEHEGTSLNQFLVSTIAERVGAGNLYSIMSERLERRSIQVAAQSAAINDMMRTIATPNPIGTSVARLEPNLPERILLSSGEVHAGSFLARHSEEG